MAINPYDKYKENSLSISSPEQMVIMLVEGAVKYTKIARLALQKGNKERAHKELLRVQGIYAELMASLDLEAGDFTLNLLNIYNYIRDRLIEANIKKDIAIIDEVMPLIEDVRDMWCEIKRNYDLGK